MRFRHYSPRLGRWLERDPLVYVDGMSLYEYATSNPATGQDPTGLQQSTSAGFDCSAAIDKLMRISRAWNTRCGGPVASLSDDVNPKTIRGAAGNITGVAIGAIDETADKRLKEALKAVRDAQRRGNRGGARLGESLAQRTAARESVACKLLKSTGTKLAGNAIGVLGLAWDVETTLDAVDAGDTLGAISSGSSAAGGLLVLTGEAAAALGVESGAIALITGPGAIVIVSGAIVAAGIDAYYEHKLAKSYDPQRNGHCEQLRQKAEDQAKKIMDAGCCEECNKK